MSYENKIKMKNASLYHRVQANIWVLYQRFGKWRVPVPVIYWPWKKQNKFDLITNEFVWQAACARVRESTALFREFASHWIKLRVPSLGLAPINISRLSFQHILKVEYLGALATTLYESIHTAPSIHWYFNSGPHIMRNRQMMTWDVATWH